MSAHDDQDELQPSITVGYKPGVAKTAEEYAKLDAEDESLARWKASLGIVPGAQTPSAVSGPKLTLLTLELSSSTLPPGRKIVLDLKNTVPVEGGKITVIKEPVIIKEGIEYNVQITFRVNHSIISGVRYIQVVKRIGVTVDKIEQMLGSYAPNPDGVPYVKVFEPEKSPAGIVERSGSYNVHSRVIDDDGEVYAEWKWVFKLAKEW